MTLARKHISEKDERAEPAPDEKGDRLPDVALRDAEYVPFGKDIYRHFEQEVLPHWPDAWIDETTRDEKDGQIGIVGTEINFNRYFYKYQPPRRLKDIHADIVKMEEKFTELLKRVSG